MGAHNVYRLLRTPSGDIAIRVYPTSNERMNDHDANMIVLQECDSAEALQNILPPDRSKRFAWRWQGNRVIIDPTVPGPLHPQQSLLDEIAAATTVAALKTALLKMVKG